MTSTALAQRGGVQRAPNPSGLADVLDLILDKGLVIDAYIRVSVVGIELLTIDARIVVASVDTSLRFAEAVSRLDIAQEKEGLPGLLGGGKENPAVRKTRGVLQGVGDKLREYAESEGQRASRRRSPGER